VGPQPASPYAGAVLGGPDLLAYLVLALGAAMAVGSILALVRPPEARQAGDLEQAPLVRSIAFAAVGIVAALWALGSLVTS
jgi:hypothetical protein